MLTTTIKIIRSVLESDPSLTLARRNQIMAILRSETKPRAISESAPKDSPPRLLRRAEVARRLACCLRTVDKLPIRKVKLPGRQRAAGFLEGDINELLVGKETS